MKSPHSFCGHRLKSTFVKRNGTLADTCMLLSCMIMMASEILMSMGSITASMLKGPCSLSATSNIASAKRFTDALHVTATSSGYLHPITQTSSWFIVHQRAKWVNKDGISRADGNNHKHRGNLPNTSFKQTNTVLNTDTEIRRLLEDPGHHIPIKYQCAEFINSWHFW